VFYDGGYVDSQEFIFSLDTNDGSDGVIVSQKYLPGYTSGHVLISIDVESSYLLTGDVIAVNPDNGQEVVLIEKYNFFENNYWFRYDIFESEHLLRLTEEFGMPDKIIIKGSTLYSNFSKTLILDYDGSSGGLKKIEYPELIEV